MSYKPIAPAPSSSPGPSAPIPEPEVSHSRLDARAAAPFSPLFNDCGPPSMGYMQAVKPRGARAPVRECLAETERNART
ncbi:cyclin-dependent kinase 2-associated protein 2-like [Physeter macrocephalus]|uniref:Cyclin-dependent kinase 2-associated protein 2-like n=1 Tax=Physeter macrocephalus TaxID=9755 RepID=A0A9W2WAX2_PHYMC|nr:cyclin-dependent kinase 2-associated protein 2-like [Physeter catodon]